MGKGHRPERLGEEIRKTISELLISGDLKDPAFGAMICVSGVDVTRDGSYADVFVSALSYTPGKTYSEEERAEILKAFERAKPFIRSEINKRVKVRYVPDLIFKFDNSLEYGAHMDKVLDSLDIKPAEPEEEVQEDDF